MKRIPMAPKAQSQTQQDAASFCGRRVLLLNYEFPPLGGGGSPVSYEIAQRLSQLTSDLNLDPTQPLFDIDVVTMGYKDLPNYQEVNPHFRIHRVKCLRGKKEICHPWEQATYLVTGYLKARKLLKKNKYDVCHCHFIIPTGVIALQLKKEFGLDYVITSHGSDVLGYGARFKKIYPLIVKPWKKILDHAKRIITPSNFLKGEIIKAYLGFDANKIEVIPNGFDTSRFVPREKKKWIFSSGRLLPNKGFQYLIQAVSDEDIGYEVHIAGDGPMMGELKVLAERSKTKVVLHGWLNNNGPEYKELIERSAIYVLASEKENASISLLEAMSAGCAMITTNTGGTAETVGDAGVLVGFGDVEALKRDLTDLISRDDRIRGLGLNARTRVSDIFDWSVVLRHYTDVLNS